MESQPQKPDFRINPENFHPCGYIINLALGLHHYFQNKNTFNIEKVVWTMHLLWADLI